MIPAPEKTTIEHTLIGMEKAALERWNNGDPDGFLELSASDVVYFDPFQERRLNGLEELTRLYNSLRGMASIERYEMIDPLVQMTNNMAVLTFNLKSWDNEKVYPWNCTEVYRLETTGEWKIIQTHWSITKPDLK